MCVEVNDDVHPRTYNGGWMLWSSVGVVFCQHKIYLSPVEPHDGLCETSFQTLNDGNIVNVSAGVFISKVAY